MSRRQASSPLTVGEEILTTEEVAVLTTVPVGTLKAWRHYRQGPRSFKLGGRIVRYRRADVDAWLGEQYATTDRPKPTTDPR